MKKAWLVAAGLILCSIPAVAGEYLINDTGHPIAALRVVFSEPVLLTGFGDVLLVVEPHGESAEFIFSGGVLGTSDGHWLNWEPASARLVSFEWLSSASEAPAQGVAGPSGGASPFPVPVGRPDDPDGDGLTSAREEELGTSPDLWDTDGDGLSDFAEIAKYRTDPLQADSDGDGIPDGDWTERREFTYTVEVRLKLRNPFDLSAMNDLYQDARLVQDIGNGYSLIDVLLYPDAGDRLVPMPYPVAQYPPELSEYLAPGIATCFDDGMKAEVSAIVAGAKTDVDAVARILAWVQTKTTAFLPCSVPEVYYTTLDANGNVRMSGFKEANSRLNTTSGPCDIPSAEEILHHQFFAISMFNERVHGTCTSIATLKCAMIRAAGIPCRLLYTAPVLYYIGGQSEPFEVKLSRASWSIDPECSHSYSADSYMHVNHAFIESWLGGRWVRVDRTIDMMYKNPRCLFVNLLTLKDWTEVDFSRTYPGDWRKERPYYALRVADQEAIYQPRPH